MEVELSQRELGNSQIMNIEKTRDQTLLNTSSKEVIMSVTFLFFVTDQRLPVHLSFLLVYFIKENSSEAMYKSTKIGQDAMKTGEMLSLS